MRACECVYACVCLCACVCVVAILSRRRLPVNGQYAGDTQYQPLDGPGRPRPCCASPWRSRAQASTLCPVSSLGWPEGQSRCPSSSRGARRMLLSPSASIGGRSGGRSASSFFCGREEWRGPVQPNTVRWLAITILRHLFLEPATRIIFSSRLTAKPSTGRFSLLHLAR